ncbi:MAG TPA: ATP-binding cassette domain-containing protein [Variovorax sp.]
MSTAPTTSVLQVQDLAFAYPGQPALASGWSTSLGPGLILLHGDTGSGKSTLLRLMAGALPASRGRLTLAGLRLDQDAEAYGRQLFFIDPATDAFDKISARACIASLSPQGQPAEASALAALIEGFGLAPHLDKAMYMLSTGSRRKVWLAAALASTRPLTLLDEPAGALDAASIRCLWRAVDALARQPGCAVVVASSERLAGLRLAATIELPLEG